MAKRTNICITLMVLMTYEYCSAYQHHSSSTSHRGSSDYFNYDYYDPHHDHAPAPNPISRVDHAPAYSNQHQRHSQFHVVSRTNEGHRSNLKQDRPAEQSELCDEGEHRSAERSQVVGERSAPLNSDVQKVQDDERTRHSSESRKKSSMDRSINGTGKIVNSPKIHNRRGDMLTQEITDRVHSIVNKSISVVMKIMRNGQSSRDPGNNRTPLFTAHNGAPAQPEEPHSRDSVVFPGDVSSRVGRGFVPDISDVPEECKRMGVCENVKNYPHEHVAQLVEKLGESRNIYKIDEVESPELTQRIGPNEETEMCQFTQKVIIPQAAPDKKGKWFYILNTRENPLQGFNVELCNQDKSPCNNIASFLSGYEASCKQKYVLRYMTSIDEHTGQTVERSFKMPSCCSCVLRHML